MNRPMLGEGSSPPAPAPGVNGYSIPSPTAGQFAPNPFAVATPTAPPQAVGRSLPTVGELFSALKRRWPLALMIGAVLGGVLAAAVWMAMPSGKHQVQATLQFKSTLTNATGGVEERIPQEQFDVQVENHKKYMETKKFLDQVAAQPELNGLAIFGDAVDRAAVIKELLAFKRESYEIVTLTMNGDQPEDMQKILKTLVAQYISKDTEDARKQLTDSLAQVDKQLKEVEKQIADKQDAIRKLARDKGSADPDTINRLNTQIFALDGLKTKYGEEQKTLSIQRDQLTEQLKAGTFPLDQADVDDLLKVTPAVDEAKKVFAAATAAVEKAEKTYNPGDPAITKAKDKAAAAAKLVEAAGKDAVAGAGVDLKEKAKRKLEARLKDLTDKEEVARKSFEATAAEQKGLIDQVAKIKDSKIDQDFAKDALAPLMLQKGELLQQQVKLQRVADNPAKRIEELEEARIWMNYNLKTKAVFSTIAGLAGLFGVGLLVSYLEWRNRRVDGVDQVVAELGMRVIGTIPAFPSRAALRSGEAGANQNWRFILNESVNSTRTMLLHTARTQQMQVILVTSAMQGEGKTSLSSQLATSMATAGLRTLILDCDLRNPSMQKLFDIPVAPGCAEILLQEIDISDAVQQTSVPNLWIIPAGQCNHRVIAALAQGHPIEALLNRLRGQFDIIVVDSCPILPVADTLLVAQHVDGVVFSILQDVSQLPKVQDASDRLIQLNIPLLGAVVNGIKPDIQAYGYNYVKQLPA